MDVRTIYELRKTTPLTSRRLVARVFNEYGRFGLVDATGAIWPIYFRPNIAPPKPGQIITAACSSMRPDGNQVSKYEDSGFFIVVEEIIETVDNNMPWPINGLPSPLALGKLVAALTDADHTHFMNAPTQARTQHLKARNLGIDRTREFFSSRGFVHIETSTLVPSGGVENYLSCFTTSYKDHRNNVWPLALPTSPEFGLKKILAEGFEKIFQISRSFRNEGQLSKWHEPEFFMLEWYRTGARLDDMMEDTRKLVLALSESLNGIFEVPQEWKTFSVSDLFKKLMDLDLKELQERDVFLEAAEACSSSIVESDDWDSIFCKLFMERVEPFLKEQEACFVTGYPKQMAALAQLEPGTPFALRFEAYLNGIEICNGYQELTQAAELVERFDSVSHARPETLRDRVFEDVAKFGIPSSAGNALGLDRVIAVLLGLDGISQLYPAPFLSQFPQNSVANE